MAIVLSSPAESVGGTFEAPRFDRNPMADQAFGGNMPTDTRQYSGVQPIDPKNYVTLLDGRTMSRGAIAGMNHGTALLALMDRNAAGTRGFVEAYTDVKRLKGDLPFVGDLFGVVMPVKDILRVRDISKRLEADETVSDEDMVLVQTFVEDQKRMSQTSAMGMVGDIARAMPLFAAEIYLYGKLGALGGGAAGSAAGGVGAAPGAVAGAIAGASTGAVRGTIKGARYVAKKMLSEGIQNRIGKLLATTAGKQVAARTVKFGTGVVKGALTGAAIAGADTAVNALVNTAMGQDAAMSRGAAERYAASALAGEDMSLGMAKTLATGDRLVEYISEMSGEAFSAFIPSNQIVAKAFDKVFGPTIARAAGALAKGTADVAAGKLTWVGRQKIAALGALAFIAKKMSADGDIGAMLARLAKFGYDGYVEEILEERYGDFIRGFTGISGEGAGFRNALSEMIPDKKQLIAEMIGFAIPLGATVAIKRGHMAAHGFTTSTVENDIRTVVMGAQQVAPSGNVVELDAATGKLKNVRGVEMPSVEDSYGGISRLAKMTREKKTTPLGRVADFFLEAGSLLITGHMSGLSQLSGADILLSSYSRPALIGMHNRVFNEARARLQESDPTMSQEQLDAGAEAEARATTTETLSMMRKTIVARKSILERMGITEEEEARMTPGELVEKMNEKVRSGELRRVSYDNDNYGFWAFAGKDAEADTDPMADAVASLNATINEVLVRHGYNRHITKIRTVKEGAQAMTVYGKPSMTVTMSELEEMGVNPMTVRGTALAGLAGMKSPHRPTGAAAIRALARRLKEHKDAGDFGTVYQQIGIDGSPSRRVKVTKLPNGRIHLSAATTYTGKGSANDASIVRGSQDLAEDLMRQMSTIDPARQAGWLEAKLREQDLQKAEVEDIVFHNREVLEFDDPRILARMVYGLMTEKEIAATGDEGTKAKARAEKLLVDRYGPSVKTEAGTYVLDFGNLNSEGDITISASLDSYHMLEELLERIMKIDNRMERGSAARYHQAVGDFVRAVAAVLKYSRDIPPATRTALLGLTKSPSDFSVKTFAALFLGAGRNSVSLGMYEIPFMEELRDLREQLQKLPGYQEWVAYMAEVTGVTKEGQLQPAVLSRFMDATATDGQKREMQSQLRTALQPRATSEVKQAEAAEGAPKPPAKEKKAAAPAKEKAAAPAKEKAVDPLVAASQAAKKRRLEELQAEADAKETPEAGAKETPEEGSVENPVPAHVALKQLADANQNPRAQATGLGKKRKPTFKVDNPPPSATPSVMPAITPEEMVYELWDKIESATPPDGDVYSEFVKQLQTMIDSRSVAERPLFAKAGELLLAVKEADVDIPEFLDAQLELEAALARNADAPRVLTELLYEMSGVRKTEQDTATSDEEEAEDDAASDIDTRVFGQATSAETVLRSLRGSAQMVRALETLNVVPKATQALYDLTHDPVAWERLQDALVSTENFVKWVNTKAENESRVESGLKFLARKLEQTAATFDVNLGPLDYYTTVLRSYSDKQRLAASIARMGADGSVTLEPANRGDQAATALENARSRIDSIVASDESLPMLVDMYNRAIATTDKDGNLIWDGDWMSDRHTKPSPSDTASRHKTRQADLVRALSTPNDFRARMFQFLSEWTGSPVSVFASAAATPAGREALARMIEQDVDVAFSKHDNPLSRHNDRSVVRYKNTENQWAPLAEAPAEHREKVLRKAMQESWTGVLSSNTKNVGHITEVLRAAGADAALLTPTARGPTGANYSAWQSVDRFIRGAARFFAKYAPGTTIEDGGLITVPEVVATDAKGREHAYQVSELTDSEWSYHVQRMHKMGYFYTGVYGDKNNNRFIKRPPVPSVEKLVEDYKAMYNAPGMLWIDQLCLVPVATVESWAKALKPLIGSKVPAEIARREALQTALFRALYVPLFDHEVDGNMRYYIPKDIPDELLSSVETAGPLPESRRAEWTSYAMATRANWTKRRSNSLTGNETLEGVERFLGGPVKMLVIDSPAVDKSADGQMLFADSLGRASVSTLGARFVGYDESATTLKIQFSPDVDDRGQPGLGKFNGVNIEAMTASHPYWAQLKTLMDATGAHVVYFTGSRKVPSAGAFAKGLTRGATFVPVEGALDSAENIAAATAATAEIKGSDLIAPLSLAAPTTARRARFAKQVTQILASAPSAQGALDLVSKVIEANADAIDATDLDTIRNEVIARLSRRAGPEAEELVAGLKNGTVDIMSPRARRQFTVVSATARRMQFTVDRIRAQVIGTPDGANSLRLSPIDGRVASANANLDGKEIVYAERVKAADAVDAKAQFATIWNGWLREGLSERDYADLVANPHVPGVEGRQIKLPPVGPFAVALADRPAGPREIGFQYRGNEAWIPAGFPVIELDAAGRPTNLLDDAIQPAVEDGQFMLFSTRLLADRIPAEGFQSMAFEWLRDRLERDGNLIERSQETHSRTGGDYDGDTANIYLISAVDKEHRNILATRVLSIFSELYRTDAQLRKWAEQTIEPAVDGYKDLGTRLKAKASTNPSIAQYNGPLALRFDFRVGTAGKDLLAVAAKSSSTLRRALGAGVYLDAPISLNIDGTPFVISRTKEEAEAMLTPGDPAWDRMNLAMFNGPIRFISWAVDDMKDPTIAFAFKDKMVLAMAVVALAFDQATTSKTGEFKFDAEFADAELRFKSLVTWLANHPFLNAVTEAVSGPQINRLRGDKPPSIAKAIKEELKDQKKNYLSKAEWAAWHAAKQAAADRGEKLSFGEFIAENTEVGALIRLHGLANSLRDLGVIADAAVGTPRVQTAGDIRRLATTKLGELTGLRFTHPDRFDPASTVTEKLKEIAPLGFLGMSPAGNLLADAVAESTEAFNPLFADDRQETMLTSIHASFALKALVDESGLELDARFPATRIRELKDAHKAATGNNSAFWNLVAPSGQLLGALELLPVYSGPVAVELNADTLAKARREFDEFPRKLQLEIAVAANAAFSPGSGARAHAINMLLGDPVASQFLRDRTRHEMQVHGPVFEELATAQLTGLLMQFPGGVAAQRNELSRVLFGTQFEPARRGARSVEEFEGTYVEESGYDPDESARGEGGNTALSETLNLGSETVKTLADAIVEKIQPDKETALQRRADSGDRVAKMQLREIKRQQMLATKAPATKAPVIKDLSQLELGIEEAPKLGFTVTTKPGVRQEETKKAPVKAANATKYIGLGGGSTGRYRTHAEDQGIPVNSEEYTADDVVFVSVNGAPTAKNLDETERLVRLALDAGATVLADSEAYLSRSTYNRDGEGELAKRLLAAGYERTPFPALPELIGAWRKPVVAEAIPGTYKAEALPSGKATVIPGWSDAAMNFPMAAQDNVTGKPTTTMRGVIEGWRTGTTRHWKNQYKPGDRFEFQDRNGNKQLIEVEEMTPTIGEMIRRANGDTDAVLRDLASREGWTFDAFKRHYQQGRTVTNSSRQLRFHRVVGEAQTPAPVGRKPVVAEAIPGTYKDADAINRAAAQALGVSERLYPADDEGTGDQATPSVQAVEVSPEGKVKLGFSWNLASIPERVRKQQTLEQQLKRLQVAKDEAAAFLNWAKGKTGDSVELQKQFEAEVLPELEIVRPTSRYVDSLNREWDSIEEQEEAERQLQLDPEGRYAVPHYEALSVNKGQGEYKEYFIRTPFPVPGQHGEFQDPNLAGWFRVREHKDGVQVGTRTEQPDNPFGAIEVPVYSGERTLEIQEIQSELFQKNKGGFREQVGETLPDDVEPFEEGGRYLNEYTFSNEQATFLNLMLKDQTWVPVFVNAIKQWARNQGFTKVRFPTGETAARVEGHQVLADRLETLQKEREKAATMHSTRDERIRELDALDARLAAGDTVAAKAYVEESGVPWDEDYSIANARRILSVRRSEILQEVRPIPQFAEADVNAGVGAIRLPDRAPVRPLAEIDAEINELKTQGIEKLAPIEAFYEKRVAAIANRMGAVPVTDANGNTWREVDVTKDQATPSVQAAGQAPRRKGPLGERAPTLKQLVNWRGYQYARDEGANTEFERAEIGKEIRAAWAPYREKLEKLKTFVEAHDYIESLRGKKIHSAVDAQLVNDLDIWAETHLPLGTTPQMLLQTELGGDTAPAYQQLDFSKLLFDASDRATPSVRPVIETFEGWYTPAQGGGAAFLTQRLVEESSFATGERNRAKRWYVGLVQEWGLDGVIRKFEEHTFNIDAEGKEGEYKTQGLKMWWSSLNAPKLTDNQRKAITLLHYAAFQGLEYTARTPDQHRRLKAGEDFNVILGIPIEADLKTLETILPAPLAARLFKAVQDAKASVARPAPGNAAAERAYERAVARVLYNQDLARFQLRSTQKRGRNLDPERHLALEDWTPRNMALVVSANEVRKALKEAGAEGELSAYAQLVEAGRDKDRLNLETIVNEAADQLDGMHRRLRSRVPWLMRRDSLFLKYREGYSVHYFGSGYMGPNEKQAQLELERLIDEAELRDEATFNAVMRRGKAEDMSDRPLDDVSDRMFNYLYDLKGIPYPGRAAAMAAIRDGELVPHGIAPEADYAAIATEIHLEVMQLLHDRRLANQALEDRLDSIANPVELAKMLGEIRKRFKKRESTNRARQRKFDTFEDAFVLGGKRPLGLGAGDAVQRYATDVMLSARTRVVLNEAVYTEDADGNMLVVPDPDLNADSDADYELLAKDVWDAMASRLAENFKYTLDPNKSAKQNVKDIVDKHIKDNPRYQRVAAPFSSVPAFYGYRKPGGEENVLDALFAGGEVPGLLKKIYGKPWEDPYGILKFLEHANQWMKVQSLQYSLFFPTAAQESLLALLGHKYFSKDGMPSQVELRRMIKARHPWVMSMLREADSLGLELGGVVSPLDVSTDMIASDIEFLHDFTAKNFGDATARGVKGLLSLSRKQTDFMFESYFNTVKLWAFMRFKHELQERALNEGREFDLQEEIGPYMDYLNSEIGGINWNKVSWMTPSWRRNLQLLMFSPNWSQSAVNAAGFGALTGPVLKNYNTPEELKFIMRHRWPNMFLWVMMTAPAVVQAAAYSIAAAFGGVGDDDEFLMFNNEEGRKLHADITPLMRMMPWYKGAPTGQRRTYIRWGKQAYETKRWLEAPWASLMGKSSQIARWALEMATGESVGGYGWSLPFQDQGLVGWVRDKDGNFMGSRLGYTVQKFMPFSLLAWAQNPDAAPLQIIGPTSKGISFYNATQAYTGILDTWARSTTYEQLYRNPRIQANLEALGFDILEAARRNGYEPKNVIKSAVGAVMKDLYANLYKAVDANDQKGIERWSRAIIRLNGTVNRALQSTRNRDKMYGTSAELSKEHEALVREAFENP